MTHPEKPALIYRLRSIVDRMDLGEVFVRPQPLEVELGSGDGSFLVEWATRNSDRNFIGVERLLGRLRKIDRKGRRAGLTNLCGIQIESAYFLEYLLPPGCARAIHLYFPDPWPKRKQRRNRIVNERFPTLAAQVLVPGGYVYLRTDDADYFAQMRDVFAGAASFREVETPAELAAVTTDFERDFNARGIETLRSAYTFSPAGG